MTTNSLICIGYGGGESNNPGYLIVSGFWFLVSCSFLTQVVWYPFVIPLERSDRGIYLIRVLYCIILLLFGGRFLHKVC
jgi:hypothetical protein